MFKHVFTCLSVLGQNCVTQKKSAPCRPKYINLCFIALYAIEELFSEQPEVWYMLDKWKNIDWRERGEQVVRELQRRWNSLWGNWSFRQTLQVLGILIGAALFGFTLLTLLIYWGAFGPIPTYGQLRDIRNNVASEVYGADSVLLGKYYVENRVNADFEELSPHLIEALVATEDARYFRHGGIDLRAIIRVALRTVVLGDESGGGGSTLSQQLAKNLYPRKDYWMFSIAINKLREMITARRLEQLYTKEELLRLYLNTVPFSQNVYGVKVAARRFFDRSPKALRIEEAAVLVGMLKATTYYDPQRYPARALQRRNTVLGQMEKYGYLDMATCDSLQLLPIVLSRSPEEERHGLAPYFRAGLEQDLEEVLADLRRPDGQPYNLYTDGLRIYTTIDSRLQRYAERAVREHLQELQAAFLQDWQGSNPIDRATLERAVAQSARYQRLKKQGMPQKEIERIFATPITMRVYDWQGESGEREMSPLDSVRYYLSILHAGFLAVNPQTGAVKVWVGGIDYGHFQFDHVRAKRQVGSTFKPIVYAQALESGMLPCEYTPNNLVTYANFDNWEPRNSNGKYGGAYSMQGALMESINTVAVEVLWRAGLPQVVRLAGRLGISGEIPEKPAVALGSVDASLWEMAQVYSTLANRGRRPTLYYLERIETADGQLLKRFDPPRAAQYERVLPEPTADVMNHLLRSVVDKGTASRLRYRYGIREPLAGKTGTSQNQADGWFFGYTPRLTAGVWVGADLPGVHFRSLRVGQGASSALPIYGRFMQFVKNDKALHKELYANFTPPPDSMLALMDCPPFVEGILADKAFQEAYYENPVLYNRLFAELTKDTAQVEIKLKQQRRHEDDEDYYARMLRYNQRRMRRQLDEEDREERKRFWSRVLFGNNSDEEEPAPDIPRDTVYRAPEWDQQ